MTQEHASINTLCQKMTLVEVKVRIEGHKGKVLAKIQT